MIKINCMKKFFKKERFLSFIITFEIILLTGTFLKYFCLNFGISQYQFKQITYWQAELENFLN